MIELKQNDSILEFGNNKSDKIAAFDLDGTLINTKSGAKFAKNANDWKIAFPNVFEKLKELREQNYSIAIITNQNGLKNKDKIDEFEKKINLIFKDFVPDSIYVALKKDYFRKPYPGIWELIKPGKNSFYVGDAAGRESDHSQSDAAFAYNYDIKFYTPEAFFLNAENEVKLKKTDFGKKVKLELPKLKGKVVYLMIGKSGSGKSKIAKKLKAEYVSNDLQGKKSFDIYKELISEGKNVVIDNTNPDKNTRKKWIDLAKDYHIVYIWVDHPFSEYLNKYRYFTNKESLIPDIAYRVYDKKFQEPTDDEYDTLIKVNGLIEIPKKKLYFEN